MIKLRLFWRWTVIIIYNHAIFHVHRNPVKRKAAISSDLAGSGGLYGSPETYPAKGE